MLWLEDAVREHLNETAMRRMAVLRPLKVTLTPAADGEPEASAPGVLKTCQLDNHPQIPELGKREVTLGSEIYVEQEDFMEDAPKKFFRLKPGGSVRLRGAGIATCKEVIKDDAGQVVELRCSFNPDTTALVDGKKVKGTIHWVDAATAVDCQVRLYDHLFADEAPDRISNTAAKKGKTFLDNLNPNSLETLTAKCEPALAEAAAGERFQFERLGYFYADPADSQPGKPAFNRTVTLRDTWGKTAGK